MLVLAHLAIAPESDLALLYAIANVLIARGSIDRDFIDAHTEGLDDFARHVEAFTPQAVSPIVGLPVEAILKLAETIERGERVSFWWTMGVNQSHEAVRTAHSRPRPRSRGAGATR